MISVTKPATATKPTETSAPASSDKMNEDASKLSNADENPDGEEIADDLSEISDEADDILAQQEVSYCLRVSQYCFANQN